MSFRFVAGLASLAVLVAGCAVPGPHKADGTVGPLDADWQVLASERFDHKGVCTTNAIETDPGIRWTVGWGQGRFRGTTTDTNWGANAVDLPVSGDNREWLELAADVSLRADPAQLVVELQGLTDRPDQGLAPLALFLGTWTNLPIKYCLSTQWLLVTQRVEEAVSPFLSFGDEDRRMHRLRITMDRGAGRIFYHAGDRLLGTVWLGGEVGPVTRLRLKVDTADSQVRVNCRVDNLSVRATGKPYTFGQPPRPLPPAPVVAPAPRRVFRPIAPPAPAPPPPLGGGHAQPTAP